MKNNENLQAHALPGERGIPSVNENQRKSMKKGLGLLLLVGGLFISITLGLLSYQKTQQDNKKIEPEKQLDESASSVPERTFQLSKALERGNALGRGASSHTSLSELENTTLVDKSASSLMISEGNARAYSSSSEHSGTTGNDIVNTVLYPSQNPSHTASLLKNRHYLLAKGSFIDCVLQTRIVSTVPGMTSCVVTRNIYSDTGKVLLIERGSTVSGEYQVNLKHGQARIFVLWNRIKTPNGVVVDLDSPGTDALGGSGIPGYVDSHFWDRFGGAILLSLVQDAFSASSKAFQHNGETINIHHTSDASQKMAAEALSSSIRIPPTLYKNQGERIGIYVARDLDFRKVYDLQPE